MYRLYDAGFFLIIFSMGLYIGDFVTDNDGTTSILNELLIGIGIVAVCFFIDMYREYRSSKKKPS